MNVWRRPKILHAIPSSLYPEQRISNFQPDDLSVLLYLSFHFL